MRSCLDGVWTAVLDDERRLGPHPGVGTGYLADIADGVAGAEISASRRAVQPAGDVAAGEALAAGAVRVRPTGLICVPTRKR
jgi:hypothetical protein